MDRAAGRTRGRLVALNFIVATALSLVACRANAQRSPLLLAPAVAEFDQPAESIETLDDLANPPSSIDDGSDCSASGDADDPDDDTVIMPVSATNPTGAYVNKLTRKPTGSATDFSRS